MNQVDLELWRHLAVKQNLVNAYYQPRDLLEKEVIRNIDFRAQNYISTKHLQIS